MPSGNGTNNTKDFSLFTPSLNNTTFITYFFNRSAYFHNKNDELIILQPTHPLKRNRCLNWNRKIQNRLLFYFYADK